MKTILYFHQSAELYGSDKTLLQLVIGMQRNGFKVIVVVPEPGPLTQKFKSNNIKFIISPVLKLSRNMITIRRLFLFLSSIYSSIKKVRIALNGQKIDYIHSNTLAVLLGAFYARIYGIKHVWHIHEIIEKPKILNRIYRFLVTSFSTFVVFNSAAALKSLVRDNEKLKDKSSIIYNGIEAPTTILNNKDADDFKSKSLKIPTDSIVIGLVGRISRWKGQLLLLNAFDKIQLEYPKVHLLIIGSPPNGQEFYLDNLEAEVETKRLNSKVSILPFSDDIWKYWSCIDIAVVPSTEPEPFGLVAVEAMYAGKAVIAAKHGGLLEIIEHQHTGLLFEPNEVKELYVSLKLLVNNSTLRNTLGQNGNKYATERFTIENYQLNFVHLYQKIAKYV